MSVGQSLIESIPNELLFHIAHLCGIKDTARLIQCDKSLYDRLHSLLIQTEVRLNRGRAIIWAVSHGHDGLVKSLLHHGVPVVGRWGLDLPDDYDSDSWLSRRNPVDIDLSDPEIHLQNLEPDTQNTMPRSLSLLHIAAAQGHTDVVASLVDLGAEVRDEGRHVVPYMSGPRYDTALQIALACRHTSSAKLLIERGAAVGNRSTNNQQGLCQALHIAVRHDYCEIVRILLGSRKYDVNCPDREGRLAVNIAAEVALPTSDLEMLRLLLDAGADLTICTRCECPTGSHHLHKLHGYGGGNEFCDHSPPLHHALAGGHYDAAIMMIDAGARVDIVAAGYHPLHCVFLNDQPSQANDSSSKSTLERNQAKPSRLRCLQKILAVGADPNVATTECEEAGDFPVGITPLMLAAANSTCLESIKLLLQYGANTNALDGYWRQNALQYIVRRHRERPPYDDCVPTILQHRGYNPDIAGVARLLLESGCDPAHRDSVGHCTVRRFAEYESDSSALAVVLEYVHQNCINDGCVEASLVASLARGFLDNARLLARLVPPSEVMVMRACKALHEERTHAWYYNDPPPCEDLSTLLSVIEDFSDEHGLLGGKLREYNQSLQERISEDEYTWSM